MSTSPDQSRFSACVLGEATPAEQSAFDAALLKDATLREEAVTLSRTAHRLATAFKQEAPLSLTLSQRHTVLSYGMAPAVPRRTSRPAWTTPTCATLGIAAALALGLYLFAGTPPQPSGSGPEMGIPSIALKTVPDVGSGTHPVLPPPVVSSGPGAATIPEAAELESPVLPSRPETMAATPPVIKVSPAPVSPQRDVWNESDRVIKPASGQPATGESLASPAPRPQP